MASAHVEALEDKELPESYLVDFDLIDLLIKGLEVSVDVPAGLLLDADNSIFVALALAIHIVLGVNLQVVQGVQRMQGFVVAVIILEGSRFINS